MRGQRAICKNCGQGFIVGKDRRGVFCSISCYNTHRHISRVPIAERFWEKVRKGDSCWEWERSRTQSGYGYFRIDNRTHLAHRVAWELTNGPLPANAVLRHTCDNPACVRPDHLIPGTHHDNATDKVTRGRHPSGERSGSARLTWADVRDMRARWNAGGISQRGLARLFGVDQSHVSKILSGDRWHEEVAVIG